MERCPSSFEVFYKTDQLSSNGASKTTGACSIEDTFSSSEGILYAWYCSFYFLLLINICLKNYINLLKGHCHAIWQFYKKLEGAFTSIEFQN